MTDLHRRIRTLRIRSGMTGMELAKRSGVSPSYISLIEHGEKIPSEAVAVAIARVLNEPEPLYRVWAASSRMNEATRRAFQEFRPSPNEFQAAAPLPPIAMEEHRPPGRPRHHETRELAIVHNLEDERNAATLRISVLSPGPISISDPPASSDVESIISIDARLLERQSSHQLVAMRVNSENSRYVTTLLRPRDIVVIDRQPNLSDPSAIHGWVFPEGIVLARAVVTQESAVLFPASNETVATRSIEFGGPESLHRVLFGTVVWSCRCWQA